MDFEETFANRSRAIAFCQTPLRLHQADWYSSDKTLESPDSRFRSPTQKRFIESFAYHASSKAIRKSGRKTFPVDENLIEANRALTVCFDHRVFFLNNVLLERHFGYLNHVPNVLLFNPKAILERLSTFRA